MALVCPAHGLSDVSSADLGRAHNGCQLGLDGLMCYFILLWHHLDWVTW